MEVYMKHITTNKQHGSGTSMAKTNKKQTSMTETNKKQTSIAKTNKKQTSMAETNKKQTSMPTVGVVLLHKPTTRIGDKHVIEWSNTSLKFFATGHSAVNVVHVSQLHAAFFAD
jgi:hypothetical protein